MKPDDHPVASWTQAANRPGMLLVAAAAVVLAWIVFLVGSMPSHVFSATRFILYDQGSYLYAVGRWQAGEALYRDFAWQYGPLALGWYRGFAALGGNTPLTLVLASSAAFGLAWVLIARLLVQAAGWWGVGLALVGLLPVMAPSGPTAINGPHGAVEMLLFAVGATVLAAGRDHWWRPWLLGMIAGLLQWVRFGPHVVALGVVLVIVAGELWSRRRDGRSFAREWGAFALRLLAGYAALLLPLAAWYVFALPAAGAGEQLWPTYMVAAYAQTFPNRWPQLGSAREFFLVWLPALAGIGLALARIGGNFFRRTHEASAAANGAASGLLFFPLYYAFGCVVLFHNDYALAGQLWLAWPGLGLAALLAGRWTRAGFALLLLPIALGAFETLRTMSREEQRWGAQPLALPNGQQLWFRPDEAQHFGRLQAVLVQTGSPAPRLAVFLGGGGIHHFFLTRRVGRLWWFLPEFVRPWEREAVWTAILQSERILVVDMGQASGRESHGVVALWLPLPRAMGERLLPHLRNPRHLDSVGDLLDVGP